MSTEPTKAALAVTDADREAADTICNPTDNPHMYSILCKKFAAHRIAAFEEAAKVAESDDLILSDVRLPGTFGKTRKDHGNLIASQIRNLKGQQ